MQIVKYSNLNNLKEKTWWNLDHIEISVKISEMIYTVIKTSIVENS